MSGRIVSAVLDSALPAWLKIYAVAFASFAADDGSRVYPTVGRVARMVNRSERQAQKATTELRRRQILEVVAPAGRNTATRYQFHAERLPLAGDGAQLPLSFGVSCFPQAQPAKCSSTSRFPQDPQQLTGTPRRPRGEPHDARSVSDPKYSTYTRARAKTGTD